MYSIDFSATSYFQGKARIQSKNRTKPARLYWIFSDGGIGPYVYSAVSKKKNFTQSYYNQAKYNK
jgi:transketolase N-terminal domain/subunit